MLAKTYSPQETEPKLYAAWESANAFAPRGKGAPYTIAFPPPNVTGSLHMGHALNTSLQDILIRYYRMRGRKTLWQVGTDHAGIATQLVVEKQLATRQQPGRKEMGRAQFLDAVWRWKAESGALITTQLRRLGASCDWSRERFTMDDGFCRAVNKVFVDLFEAGLIYQDMRLVNWDPVLETAISDLEVTPTPQTGQLWYLRYRLADDSGTSLVVATTRPETLFGDMAVAVHPDDVRYQALIGKQVIVPLAERNVPIIADDFVDQEHGTGVVKVTPAHDFTDFEVGRRHGLELHNIFTPRACLNDNVPSAFRGLERSKARAQVLAALEAQDGLEKTQAHEMTVPTGERTGVVLEPYLTRQWYVDAKKLAGPARQAVRQGKTQFVPAGWSKTYFNWLDDIQPWCISRQLWWGHRIPVWYGPDDTPFAATDAAHAQRKAKAHYGKSVSLRQDADVLDTWFSSALWPFVTLGWPKATAMLARHYPTDCLITAFDIIFFWVARMMMMGLYFTKRVPFHTVYIHPIVRDAQGKKMSKSRGNVVDPLDVMTRYGADALRFTLATMAAPGRDIPLQDSRIQGYRNFASKLWNSARFAQMHNAFSKHKASARRKAFVPSQATHPLNQWIIVELAQLQSQIDTALKTYRFDRASDALYHFIWHCFCDWYLELAKPLLAQADAVCDETRACLAWVLLQSLHLLHPFMPYITESLWQALAGKKTFLMRQPWPQLRAPKGFAKSRHEIRWLIDLITHIRSLRNALHVPAAARLKLYCKVDAAMGKRLARYTPMIVRLARLTDIVIVKAIGDDIDRSITWRSGRAQYALWLGAHIDFGAEKARLTKEIARCDDEVARLDKKLSVPDFIAKAPAHVVTENRARLEQAREARAALADALGGLQQE